MKSINTLLVIAALSSTVFAVGCLDINEDLNPEMTVVITGVETDATSPESPPTTADNSSEYVYVKTEITNENEDANLYLTREHFSAEDPGRNPYDCDFLADSGKREEDSFVVQPGETKTLYAVFLMDRDVTLTLLIVDYGVDEDTEADIPAYDHLDV
jgi:hypothetical protein